MELYYYFKDCVKDKYFDALSDMLPILREAIIFKHTCELMPIRIDEGNLIAGRYGITDEPERYSYIQRDFPFENALTDDEKRIKKEFFDRFAIDVRFDKGHFAPIMQKYFPAVLSHTRKECVRSFPSPI